METYILLATALELKNTQIAKLLLTSNSNVNNKNSLFHFAILNDDMEIIQMLLDKGANVGNFNGETALHNAVERMKTEITDAANRSSKIIANLLSTGRATVDDNEDITEDADTSYHIPTNTGKHCSPLHVAVDKGNEEIIKLFLNKGANVNAKGSYDTTALHIATEKGHSKIVKLLLEHGADINSAYTSTSRKGYTSLDFAFENQRKQIARLLSNSGAKIDSGNTYSPRQGYTPLHLAVENQHRQITRLLLNNGANVNARGNDGITSLHIATEKGYLSTVKNLLNAGADVNSAYISQDGYTALHFAVENQHEQIIRLLLSKGANVNAKGTSGITSLHIATERGYSQILQLLLKHGADIHSAYTSTVREGYTSLHLAAASGDKEITELVLSKGANVNVKGRHNTTVLHIATEKGHSQVVELLLKHGADVNSAYTSTFREGYTALHLAAEKGDNEITKLLLNNGADVNAKEIYGLTSLHLASQWGYASIVDHLLKYGAHIDSVSRNGRTPLYLAIENKHDEIVKLLLECGANVNAEDKDGKTVLHFAVAKECSTIVQYILQHCPELCKKRNSSVFNVAVHCWGTVYPQIIKILLQHGFTVNPKDENNVMHAAVQKGHADLVEELLKRSTDVNMLCNTMYRDGYKPLHVAIKHGEKKVAELLISYGADVNAQDKTGKPPIFYAIENGNLEFTKLLLTNKANVKDDPEILIDAVRDGFREIVEVLLQYGADVNGCDKYGRMPLHFIILDNAKAYFDRRYLRFPDLKVRTEIAKLLLSLGANPNSRIHNGMPMLHAAIEKGYVKVVEALLEYDADVNSTCDGDMTPLYLSAILRNDEIVEMLLNKGANIVAESTNAENALLFAIDRGDTNVVELLLKCSAKIDTMTKCDMWSPLHMAVIKRCSHIVKLLLKFGADVDFIHIRGFTALHCATKVGYGEIITILLEHGADITITTPDNYTAIDFAMDGMKGSHDDDKTFDYELIFDGLKRHIIMVKAANLHAVNKRVLSISSDDEEQSDIISKIRKIKSLVHYDFQDDCEEEVARLRCEKFENTYITVYDILTKDVNQLAIYAKNESIVEALESGDYNRKFPIYSRMINRNFRNGVKRKDFLERSKKIFFSFFRNFSELPRVCTEKIFSYLNDGDLRVLLDDFKLIELC